MLLKMRASKVSLAPLWGQQTHKTVMQRRAREDQRHSTDNANCAPIWHSNASGHNALWPQWTKVRATARLGDVASAADPQITATPIFAISGTRSPDLSAFSGLDALPSSPRFLTPCTMAARRKKEKAR